MSEGSRPDAGNIKKEYNGRKDLAERSPAETSHPFAVPPSEYKACTETEQIRRESNRNRDHKKRWGVLTSPISTENDSVAEEIAEKNAGKID